MGAAVGRVVALAIAVAAAFQGAVTKLAKTFVPETRGVSRCIIITVSSALREGGGRRDEPTLSLEG